MERVFLAEQESRSAGKAKLRSIYSNGAPSVLTFRQRDCVVQYICEVCKPAHCPGQTCQPCSLSDGMDLGLYCLTPGVLGLLSPSVPSPYQST